MARLAGERLIDQQVGDHHAPAGLIAVQGAGPVGVVGEREFATQPVEIGCRHAGMQLQGICNPSLQGNQRIDVAALKQGFVKVDASEPAGLRGERIGAVGRALNDECPSLAGRGGAGGRPIGARPGTLQGVEELGKLCMPHGSPLTHASRPLPQSGLPRLRRG